MRGKEGHNFLHFPNMVTDSAAIAERGVDALLGLREGSGEGRQVVVKHEQADGVSMIAQLLAERW